MWRCIFATIIFNKILIFPSVSEEQIVLISPDECRLVTEHVPEKGVAYQPGIDVQGRPVKPADLSPSVDLGLKEKIEFQLILDLAKESRGTSNTVKQFSDHPGLEGNLDLGRIKIEKGRVTLDQMPLSATDQNNLYAICAKLKKAGRPKGK